MADSFDDQEPPDSRSTLYRVIEGLSVVALIVAIFVWQSDGTLSAARRFFAGSGDAPSTMAATPAEPASDIRLVVAAAPPPVGSPFDTTPIGSIAPAAVPGRSTPAPEPRGWTAACDDGAQFCSASQSLSRADDPALETSWTIEKGRDGLVAVWTTPTGVMVSRGMTLMMGTGKPKTVPYDSCGPRSCEVRARLAADFIGLLRSSNRLSTEIVLRGGRTVSFEFSRDGLIAALDRLGV